VLGYLVLFGAFMGSFSVVSYLGGLRNHSGRVLYMMGGVVLLLPLAGTCLPVAAFRILVSWPKYIHNRKRLRMLQVAVVLGLTAYLGLPFTGVVPPGYKTHTWGFRRYARAHADIPAMRTWLSTLDPNICGSVSIEIGADQGESSNPVVTEADLPAAVLDLKPRSVELSLDTMKRPMVCLLWNPGMMGSWGLTVGHEAMEVPETQRTTKRTRPDGQMFYDYGQYRLPVGPGAYVWFDLE